jgi:transcriptional regulator with XRE-family HTH domain
MTGKEFQEAMKRLGLTQTRLAQVLGCDRGTIIARCKMDVVDVPYRYIMLGLLSEKAASDLVLTVGSIGK